MNAVEMPEVDPIGDAVREMREQMREAGETPERAKARTAAYAEARKQFANQWAAVREVWDGDRLVEPLVLATGASVGEVDEKLRQLFPNQIQDACIRYLGPPVRRFSFHR